MDFNTKVEQLSASVEQGIDRLANRLDQTDEIKSLAYSMKINVKVLAARLSHTNTEQQSAKKEIKRLQGENAKLQKNEFQLQPPSFVQMLAQGVKHNMQERTTGELQQLVMENLSMTAYEQKLEEALCERDETLKAVSKLKDQLRRVQQKARRFKRKYAFLKTFLLKRHNSEVCDVCCDEEGEESDAELQ
jgi:glycyl-tRNA synthetase alpha subunit